VTQDGRPIGGRPNIEILPGPTGARARRADSAELTVVPTGSWTIEQIDLVKRLCSEGLTAVAIAVRIGCLSRSAVLGKIHQLRLGTDKAAASPGKAKSAAERCAETAPARRRRGGKRGKHPQPAPAAVRQHKTLFELTNKTCRWIVEATIKLAIAWAWSHLH